MTSALKKQNPNSNLDVILGYLNKSMMANTEHYISRFAKNTTTFITLLNSSKGRDKFCQLIQYAANLYITCMKSSELYGPMVKLVYFYYYNLNIERKR